MLKNYLTQILFLFSFCAHGQNQSTGNIECLTDFRITKFKINDSGQALKFNWKVVVDREIEYRAKPKVGESWNWQIGFGDCDSFTPF